MSIVKGLVRPFYRQSKNIVRLLRGLPIQVPSFGSNTLDKDDVELARFWLLNTGKWYGEEIVAQYHTEFAGWNGSKYAFSFMGGRVALSAAIDALGLQEGDEVIVPGYTCVVVPNAFKFAGINIVYGDIELDTYGLDAAQLEEKITEKTKAVLIHHLYGLVCRDYEATIRIARKYNLKVIEDCAQSSGAEYKGKKVGNLGDVAIYSSEQSKVFTTIQGGMVTTNNDLVAEELKKYYDNTLYAEEETIRKQMQNLILNYYLYKHPKRWLIGDYWLLKHKKNQLITTTPEEIEGKKPAHYGRKMPAPIAAIGLNQLKKIDTYNEQRRRNALRWDSWCDKSGYQKPVIVTESKPVYLRYPVLVEAEKKRNMLWAEKELRVRPGVWFVSHLHPSPEKVSGCPNADIAIKRCINLPTS